MNKENKKREIKVFENILISTVNCVINPIVIEVDTRENIRNSLNCAWNS